LHQTIKKVTNDMERIRFNTMIAALMEFTNYLAKVKEQGQIPREDWCKTIETLLILMAPTAPHITEELWKRIGKEYSIHNQNWPTYNEELAKSELITLVVQINGRVRDRISAPAALKEDEARWIAAESKKIAPWLEGKDIDRVIYVPDKLINLVTK
jgi:leucyl-tRNA synthetase